MEINLSKWGRPNYLILEKNITGEKKGDQGLILEEHCLGQ